MTATGIKNNNIGSTCVSSVKAKVHVTRQNRRGHRKLPVYLVICMFHSMPLKTGQHERKKVKCAHTGKLHARLDNSDVMSTVKLHVHVQHV